MNQLDFLKLFKYFSEFKELFNILSKSPSWNNEPTIFFCWVHIHQEFISEFYEWKLNSNQLIQLQWDSSDATIVDTVNNEKLEVKPVAELNEDSGVVDMTLMISVILPRIS